MDIFTCFNKQGGVNDNPSRLYSIVFTLEKVRNSFLLSKDSKIQIHLKPSSGRLLFLRLVIMAGVDIGFRFCLYGFCQKQNVIGKIKGAKLNLNNGTWPNFLIV